MTCLSLDLPRTAGPDPAPFPPWPHQKIQTHFVDHRSTHGPTSITAEDLGVRMRLCRALALSEGAAELSWAMWERGWEIEEKRRERGDGLLKKAAEPAPEKLVGR